MERGSPRMVVDRARTPPLLSGAGGEAPAHRRGGTRSSLRGRRATAAVGARAVITPAPGPSPPLPPRRRSAPPSLHHPVHVVHLVLRSSKQVGNAPSARSG